IMISNNEEQDLQLTKYVNKSTEFKIIRHILDTKNNVLQLRKKILKEKYEELDNINYNVWITEDKFCNEIWNFSLNHNFNLFFNQNLHIMEVNKFHECKYNTMITEDVRNINIYNKILKLKNEINIINNEIILIRNKITEQDLKCHKYTLDNLKLFSEEILKLIRIINQKSGTCMSAEFISARKLYKKYNFHGSTLTEKKYLPLSFRTIGEFKENYNIRSNIKPGRFVMKKPSHISLKFEKNLRSSS
ncbi:PREDICTED: uncharacterized protein LOC108555853, partial [Eufriesea mexicana]|uniref:uncharacterized protein LOC108555853 n=1 Tax=Eufriesea mexicana TaxID=516756 RepID=UPI00083C06E0